MPNLFSAAETTDLLGFLDNFNDFGWENEQQSYTSPRAPYSNPHLNTAPEPSTSGRPRRSTRSAASTRVPIQQQQQQQQQKQKQKQQQQQQEQHSQQQRREFSQVSQRSDSQTPSNASESSSHNANDQSTPSSGTSVSAPPSAPAPVPRSSKPLLSTPQKRLNHIMSEQKRRNAIRDGYAQLIALLAPAGSVPGLGMPQRGRPKGSGSRDKGQSKGKSGVLFRAVEYVRWLEEGRDALRDEVLRVEAAAGIRDGASNH
ncbi:hypothetical protein B0H13DRAFT_248656 [Mycena leptocephala]|nr:hypothetical protein B0H13DRAFT_248656 [Mycena leptocephala]